MQIQCVCIGQGSDAKQKESNLKVSVLLKEKKRRGCSRAVPWEDAGLCRTWTAGSGEAPGKDPRPALKMQTNGTLGWKGGKEGHGYFHLYPRRSHGHSQSIVRADCVSLSLPFFQTQCSWLLKISSAFQQNSYGKSLPCGVHSFHLKNEIGSLGNSCS